MHKKSFLIVVIFLLINIFSYSQDKEVIKKNLSEILQQEKFQYATGENLAKPDIKTPGFIDNLLKKITELVKKLIKLFEHLKKLSPVLYFGSLILFFAVALFVLGLIIWLTMRINFSIKKYNKSIKVEHQEGYFNYELELKIALSLIKGGKFKESISFMLNALWLYYNYKKILSYQKSKTNREYLSCLKDTGSFAPGSFSEIKELVYKAEKAVYFKDKVKEDECKGLFEKIQRLIA